MARSASPLLILVVVLLILNSVVIVVRAPVKNAVTTTQRPDYFIGERVEAKLVVTYTAAAPPLPVRFEWFYPNGTEIFNETKDMTIYSADSYGAAFSNWTATIVGDNYTVRGTHLASSEFGEARFSVSTYQENVVVDSLSISMSRPYYENNTVAKAITTMGYLGNGTELKNVSFEWRYPNGTIAFEENVTSPDGGPNGTVDVNSTWAVDSVGTGFEVHTKYNGVQPLTDVATFDVIPERVKTWKNASISAVEIWAESGSPYGVCNNITVQQGAVLTVEAGSVIRFCPGTGMTIRGTLVMDGLAASPINLTSFSYPSNPGDWRNLAFEDDSNDAGSILNNVIVEFSQRGVGLNRASPTMSNLSISNSSVSGIEAYWTDITLREVFMVDCGRGIYASHTTLNLADSEILRCGDGIVMEDSNGTLDNNHVHHNTERGIWIVRSSPTIINSLITLNANKAIRIEESQDVNVENTIFSWGNFTLDSFQSIGITVKRSTFSNATNVGMSFWTTDGVLVENSTVGAAPTSLRVAGGSTVRTLNTTFDNTVVLVTGGSRLFVDNFLHIHAVDESGSPLEGASITLSLDGAPSLIGSTGADGLFKWHVIRHAVYSGLPGDPQVTWVYLGLDMDDYNFTNSPRNVNMFTSHTEDFVGQPVTPPDGNGNGTGVDPYEMVMRILIGGIIGAAVAAFVFILIKRRKTKEGEEVTDFEIKDGMVYLVAKGDSTRSFDRFISELNDGTKGLCFTRIYPKSLMKQYNLDNARVAWLSRDVDKGGLMPTNLGLITNEVDRFLNANQDQRRLILLDGVEYLIAQNGFTKVLKLLNYLRDLIGVHGASMLIPFDMKSVDEKQAALLSADLEVV